MIMKSATAKALDSTYNRMQWAGEEYPSGEVFVTYPKIIYVYPKAI